MKNDESKQLKSSGKTAIPTLHSGPIDWVTSHAQKRFDLYSPDLQCFGILTATPNQLSLAVYFGPVGRVFDVNLYGGVWDINDRINSGEELRREVIAICAQFGVPTLIRRVTEALKREGKWTKSLPTSSDFVEQKKLQRK